MLVWELDSVLVLKKALMLVVVWVPEFLDMSFRHNTAVDTTVVAAVHNRTVLASVHSRDMLVDYDIPVEGSIHYYALVPQR